VLREGKRLISCHFHLHQRLGADLRKLKICGAAIIVLSAWGGVADAQGRYRSCEQGHWIDAVMDDGSIIKLEDGSLWEVDAVDAITSSLWLPVSNVIVCDGKIINEDDNESVSAHQIK
jgi:hypothetical protein